MEDCPRHCESRRSRWRRLTDRVTIEFRPDGLWAYCCHRTQHSARRNSMNAGGWVVLSTSILLIAVAVAAQGGGGQRRAAPAGPAMTVTVAGFQDGGQVPRTF